MRLWVFTVLVLVVAASPLFEEWRQLTYKCQGNKLSRISGDSRFGFVACEGNVVVIDLVNGK